MIRLFALDLVLRVVAARVMNVALVVHVPGVHAHDSAADPPGFGILAYVIPDFEILAMTHFRSLPLPLQTRKGNLACQPRFPVPKCGVHHSTANYLDGKLMVLAGTSN